MALSTVSPGAPEPYLVSDRHLSLLTRDADFDIFAEQQKQISFWADIDRSVGL